MLEVRLAPSGGLEISFPYNAATVTKMKALGATWNPARKVWSLDIGSAAVLLRECGEDLSLDVAAVAPFFETVDRVIQTNLRMMADSKTDAPVWKEWRLRHGVDA